MPPGSWWARCCTRTRVTRSPGRGDRVRGQRRPGSRSPPGLTVTRPPPTSRHGAPVRQRPASVPGRRRAADRRVDLAAGRRALDPDRRARPAGGGRAGGRFAEGLPRAAPRRRRPDRSCVHRPGPRRRRPRLGGADRPRRPTTRLWADHSYSYLQLYTGDTQAPSRRRRSLAVEPMTGPPNALRSGRGWSCSAGHLVHHELGIQPG